MIILKVPDMHCSGCVRRIEAAFAERKLPCTVSLKEKTVTIDGKDLDAALTALDELGFDAARG